MQIELQTHCNMKIVSPKVERLALKFNPLTLIIKAQPRSKRSACGKAFFSCQL